MKQNLNVFFLFQESNRESILLLEHKDDKEDRDGIEEDKSEEDEEKENEDHRRKSV